MKEVKRGIDRERGRGREGERGMGEGEWKGKEGEGGVGREMGGKGGERVRE